MANDQPAAQDQVPEGYQAGTELGPDRRDRDARFVPASASSASDKTPRGSSGSSLSAPSGAGHARASASSGYETDAPAEGAGAIPPWLALYLRLQFELNALSSVAIEVPALRPAADALREALG